MLLRTSGRWVGADSPVATQRRLERPKPTSRTGGDADVRDASMIVGEMPYSPPLTIIYGY